MAREAVRLMREVLRSESLRGAGLGRTLVGATLGSVGVRFAGMALTFFGGVLLARYLGPEQYGIYGTAISVAALLAVPAQAGLPQLVTREISSAEATRDYGRIRSVAAWFTTAVVVGSLLMVLVGICGFHLWPAKIAAALSRPLYWGLANVPVIALLALGMGILRGLHHVVGAQLYDALFRPALMLSAILGAAAMALPLNADTALAIQVLAGTFTVLLCAIHAFRAFPSDTYASVPSRFDPAWVKSAAPMAGTEILRIIDGQYPILLLGLLAPIRDVGIFRLAIALAGFLGLPGTLINLVVMPHVAKLHALRDMRRIQMIATLSSLFCLVATGGMTLGVLLIGHPLIQVLFGSTYSESWTPLLLISVAYVINGLFGSAATILNMCGQERKLTIALLISPTIGILLTIALYPLLGIAAAGWAMIATQACQGLFMYAVAKHSLGIHLSIFGAGRSFRDA